MLLALLAIHVSLACAQLAPLAPRAPTNISLFNTTIYDDFAYFPTASLAAIKYLREEEAFAYNYINANLDVTPDTFESEFNAHKPSGNKPPSSIIGDYEYYPVGGDPSKFTYPVWMRTRVGGGAEQLVVDENALADLLNATDYFNVGVIAPSPNGSLVALTVDAIGFGSFSLRLLSLSSDPAVPAVLLPLQLGNASYHVEWGCDNNTLFFTSGSGASPQAQRVVRYNIAADTQEEVANCNSLEFEMSLVRTENGGTLLAYCNGVESNFIFAATNECAGPFTFLVPAIPYLRTYVSQREADKYIMLSNYNGAFNFALFSAAKGATQDPSTWTVLMAHNPFYRIDQASAFSNHLVTWLHDIVTGNRLIIVSNPDASAPWSVPMRAFFYDVQPVNGYGLDPYGLQRFSMVRSFVFNATTLYFALTSFKDPMATMSVYMPVPNSPCYAESQDTVPGYEIWDVTVLRPTFALADNSTPAIFVTLVFNSSLVDCSQSASSLLCDKPYPLILLVNGAYGTVYYPSFDYRRLSLLSRGAIVAIAHVRGGGMGGERWHEAGMALNKKNSIDDLITVAEQLIATRVTTSNLLVLQGVGAGAVPVAAAVVQRPNLARVAVLLNPFIDVVHTLLNTSFPAVVYGYPEWTSPYANASTLQYLASYDPYQRLWNMTSASINTSVLIQSHAPQLDYFWAPLKFIAKLRTGALLTPSSFALMDISGRELEIDQDVASQYAIFAATILATPQAGSSDSRVPGWAVGLIVVSTFCLVVLIVWMGLKHRRAIQDVLFLRVRAPVGSGAAGVDEDSALLAKHQSTV